MSAARHSFGLTGLKLIAVAAAALTAGCSSLTPQIFSDRLVTVPTTSTTCVTSNADASTSITLNCAYEEATQAQRRYMVAVRDQGNALPLLSAGLIGLSAVTLFKGATHPNTRDMVGAGVLGATALAYGNTQLSKPRLDVYRAGADALLCAMTAVEPLRPGQATLGAITDDATKPTLYGRRAAVVAKRNALQALLRRHAALNRDTEEPKPDEKACTTELKAAACPGLKRPGLSEDEVKLERARCDLLPKIKVEQCKMKPVEGTISKPPPPRVVDAFNDANDEIAAATRQVEDAQATINSMRDAGPLLAKKSQDIQLAVSAEVDKTVPNLSAVMAAAGGLRSTAFKITGASAFSPGGAQGSDAKSKAMSAADKAAAAAIEGATAELNEARVALGELAALSVGTDHAHVRRTLNDCAFKMSGVKIVITPSADSVTVPIGGSAVFFAFVSGAGSAPTATAEPAAPVTSKFEGGQFRFEFSPPPSAKAGDKFKLTFATTAVNSNTTGTTSVEHAIEVVIAAAAPAPAAAPASAPAAAPAPAATGKFKDLTKDNLTALGLTEAADDKARQKAVDNCQATANPPIAITRNFDTATKKALKDGTCKPAG